jgi:flagellar basal-body rod modification protein FlgD
MSVPAITSTQAVGTPTAAQLAALNSSDNAEGTGGSELSESDFLQLLTTQLQNQDPLQPMSDTDFIAQMATFSQLSAQNTLNTNFSSYSQTQALANAQSYIGETVSVSGATEGDPATTGIVTGITVSNGTPELTIGGTNYSLSDITGIQPGSAAATTDPTTTPASSATAAPAASTSASTATPATGPAPTVPTTPATTPADGTTASNTSSTAPTTPTTN